MTTKHTTLHLGFFRSIVAMASGLLLSNQALAKLTKVGAGEAHWGFIKLYDASFFVEKGAKPADYLADNTPAQLRLCYARKLTVQNFIDGANHALPKDLPQAQRAAVAKLHKSYRPVNKGDCYTLDYKPTQGTKLKFNDKTLTTIHTKGFKRTYFGIWLGEKPLSKTLKAKLLSKQP